MDHIYSSLSVSITEFKKNPSALIEEAGDEPVAILNHNKPMAYLLSAGEYERILDIMENYELLKIATDRLKQKDSAVSVDIDDL